jgi:hypothetical protein
MECSTNPWTNMKALNLLCATMQKTQTPRIHWTMTTQGITARNCSETKKTADTAATAKWKDELRTQKCMHHQSNYTWTMVTLVCLQLGQQDLQTMINRVSVEDITMIIAQHQYHAA